MRNAALVRKLGRIVIVVLLVMLTGWISHAPVSAQYTRFQQPVWHPHEDIIALSNGVSIRLYNGDFSQLLDEFELTTVRNPFVQNTAVAWSPDGTMLGVAIQGSDIVPALQIWDIQNGELVAQIPNISTLTTFSWGHQSSQVAIVHERGLGAVVIRIHNVPDVDTFVEFDLDDELGYIEHIAWSPDGRQIAATKDHTLYFVDVQNGQVRTSAVYMYAGFESPRFVFSPDSQYLIGVTDPNAIDATILNTSTDEIAGVLADGTYRILTVAWNKHNIVTVSLDGVTRLWDSSTFEAIVVFQTGVTSKPSFSPDGSAFVASANDYETILVRNSETGRIIASLDPIDVDPPAPTSTPVSASAQITPIPRGRAAWSPDGQFIAAFNTEPAEIDTIEVLTSDLRPVATLQLDTKQDDLIWADARDLVWSPNSTTLAAAFIVGVADGDPRPYTVIWDTASWTERFSASYQGVQISWSPSGSYLAISETILDATTGTVVNSLGDFFRLRWAVWHPTNENQLVLGFDQQINVYQPFTGEVLITYPYSGGFRPSFSPDGQYLAVENSIGEGFIVDIVDTSTYESVGTVEPTGSLGEPFGIRWLSDEELALDVHNAPLEIWDPFTQEIVDTVSISSSVWNPQATQFLYRNALLVNPFGRPPIAIYDRETEGLILQLSTQDTVQKLSLTDQAGSPLRALLSGTSITNDISSDEAADGLIEAFTYPEEVGSVAFDLNGTVTIDNAAPYALLLPSVGTYTLSATPYSEADAQGEAGLAFTVVIRIGEDGGEAISTPTVAP